MESTPSLPPQQIGIDARYFRSTMGGLGRYTRELLYHLASIDNVNQYTVFLTQADMQEWDIVQENFTPIVVNIPINSVGEQTAFTQVLMKCKFDLMHFLSYNHPIMYRRPYVVTVHDLAALLYPESKNQKNVFKRQALEVVIKDAVIAAKKVIAVSEHTAHDLERRIKAPQAKIEVIPLGSPDPVELEFGAKASVQNYLGNKQPYFLFVSGWKPHKGIADIITAFEEFKQNTNSPHALVLLGRQDQDSVAVVSKIQQSVFAADIIAPGFAPEELLPALYSYAEAFVLPSHHEGFGLTILEAFAQNAPVIAANNSSIPEISGSAALLYPTGDTNALAAEMEEIASNSDLQNELREKGQKQLQKFSWQQTAHKTLDTYYSVLEKGR